MMAFDEEPERIAERLGDERAGATIGSSRCEVARTACRGHRHEPYPVSGVSGNGEFYGVTAAGRQSSPSAAASRTCDPKSSTSPSAVVATNLG